MDLSKSSFSHSNKAGKSQTKAKEYAETALKFATRDGPLYYYKVAYEEVERMWEKLKEM